MAIPTFVYGLLLLIEAFGPLDVPMAVDLVSGGSVEDRLLLEAEETTYRVRHLETDARRVEIERSRLYGHVFFVFWSDSDESTDDEQTESRVAAVDFAPVFRALAAAQPSETRELQIEIPDGGSWTILLRGESIIIASVEEPLFLHARPAAAVLQ
ncbi:MAG: hypothetical protein ACOCW6_03750 [Spirochaetota bacterium]